MLKMTGDILVLSPERLSADWKSPGSSVLTILISLVSVTVSQYKNIHSFASLTIKLHGSSPLFFHREMITKGVERLFKTSISLSQIWYFFQEQGLCLYFSIVLIWLRIGSGGVQCLIMVIRQKGSWWWSENSCMWKYDCWCMENHAEFFQIGGNWIRIPRWRQSRI